MYKFEKYIENKTSLIKQMDEVKTKFAKLNEVGIDSNEALEKIENAKKRVSSDKVSVALVGAFSDGKTSVIAGLMNEKLDNMKIASDESSDEILCYAPASLPKDCQIVDAPGLFGDKKGSDENGQEIKLSDKTKKFISEANIVLYVVEAKNPIKDTHKPCVKWILKDLNKLSSTIFVINKMDYVADLTDEKDFAMQEKIKIQNLRSKLLECGLSHDEAEKVNIVCISASPDGDSIESWKDYWQEYLNRSRIPVLEDKITSLLVDCKKFIIEKTSCDVLNDELKKAVEIVQAQEEQISKKVIPEMLESLRRNENDLNKLRERVLGTRVDVLNELYNLELRKLNKIREASIESFKDMLEDEIGTLKGREGYRIEDEMNAIFEGYQSKNSEQVVGLSKKFQVEYENRNKLLDEVLKTGAGAASDLLKSAGNLGVPALKNTIFAGRELLGKIGIVVKFKPWQATKLATTLSKILPLIGAAIDVIANLLEIWLKKKEIEKFEKLKEELKEDLQEFFYEVREELKDDTKFLEQFAPNLSLLENQLQEEKAACQKQEEILKNFRDWRESLKDLDFVI